MQTTKKNPLQIAALLVMTCCAALGQSGPPMPPVIYLDSYSFLQTNWLSDDGYPPLNVTNLVGVQDWLGNALWLDTTNEIPAFLKYNIVETNGHLNLDLAAGGIFAFVVPEWASADTNQHGHGPGALGYLLAAGDWSSGSPDGFWAVYVDAGGTNIYFGGLSNSVATTYVSAPISWATNSLHMIGLTYSSNSAFYLDGQWAATGAPVSIVPATNTWTNGFCIGSDDLGYEQFRGIFLYVELDTTNMVQLCGTNCFTVSWAWITNGYYTWLNSPGGGEGGMFSPGTLNPLGPSTNCIFGNAVYMTNVSSSVVAGQGVTFTFAIEGGSEGAAYDLFATTNLAGPVPGNTVWTWLGQGTNCGIYSVTNQPVGTSYYILGTPLLASDGSGLTVAWERLVRTISDTYGTPDAWYLNEGLNPQTAGIGGTDSNGDGLLNWQEYLYGGNPLLSNAFAVWVSQPCGTTGLP